MPREMTAGDIREEEQRTAETERKLLKAARDHLWRRAGAGTAINLDHVRALVNGGAKDHRSYFMWTRFLIAGWERYGLPAAILEQALQSTPAELQTFRDFPLFNSWTDAELARALGRAPAGDEHDPPVTDEDTLRLVERFAASLGLQREGERSWRYRA